MGCGKGDRKWRGKQRRERETGEGEREDPDPAGYGSDFKSHRRRFEYKEPPVLKIRGSNKPTPRGIITDTYSSAILFTSLKDGEHYPTFYWLK